MYYSSKVQTMSHSPAHTKNQATCVLGVRKRQTKIVSCWNAGVNRKNRDLVGYFGVGYRVVNQHPFCFIPDVTICWFCYYFSPAWDWSQWI